MPLERAHPMIDPAWSGGEMDTVTAVFARAVSKHPDHLFVDFSGERRTYQEFDRDSNALAQGLKAIGLQQGKPLAALLDNTLDVALYWIAAIKLGAIAAPLNCALKGEFLRNQLEVCESEIILCESDYAERLTEIVHRLPRLHTVVYRGKRPEIDLPQLKLICIEDLYRYSAEAIPDENRPSDLATLIFTSGTTGLSKGCSISHNYVVHQAHQIIETDDRQPTEVAWSCLPFFHFNVIACTFISSALLGGTAYIARRFSLSGFWPDIERSGATAASVLGTMIPLIASQSDTPEMKRCKGQLRLVAGSPFPASIAQIYRQRFGVQRVGSNCFGQTEACLITMLPYGVKPKPEASGVRSPAFDVRIVDENDAECPPGIAGEIIVRPRKPHIMFEGYYRSPEATMKTFKNLWYHTGDIGKFDEEGYFFFLDRKKDYMRRGGENISMHEMESTFMGHPDVIEVAAHAVPSELLEDDVKITAVVREGATLKEEELCRWSVDRVPYFAVPRYIEFRRELPKTPTGKVEKFLLRDEGKTLTTWDRNAVNFALNKR
jgi:carnitine-CoA ligase